MGRMKRRKTDMSARKKPPTEKVSAISAEVAAGYRLHQKERGLPRATFNRQFSYGSKLGEKTQIK